MSRSVGHAGLDEDDIRVRPGKGSRPRTRRRPAHEEAVDAFVAAVDRGRYRCWVGDRPVTAMKARELGRRGIVVGDMVRLAGDVSGRPGTLARLVRVQPRSSALRRSADDTDPVERVIVANADQLVIVCSLDSPPPRPRLIDRFLVAAYDAGLEPLLCLTKADLASPREIEAAYEPLGLRYLVTARPLDAAMLDGLRAALADRVSVLVGQSGVGKSTLFNALIPAADRATGTVSPVTGRGRHTSSSALALRLPGGGWVIDTPGLRSFGLGHMSADDVVAAFPDLIEGTADCPPGCTHLGPECALPDWVARHGGAARLDSLRRLLRSRSGLDPAEDRDGAEDPAGDPGPGDPGAGDPGPGDLRAGHLRHGA
ncbi:MAG TPA: ribosome small subunit-dependent GTPase A [Streptosporangiaceae bacterium]|nr:ribosome small subunit-dependent GTPase A [Streptosporangiaceae bacterium]